MKEGSWNLNRFNHFIKKYLPNRIISYADFDWSDGGLYFMLDFSLLSYSNPDYKYIINNIRTHKSNFKKSKLKYEGTENEWSISNGLSKIWDCGKIKFERIVEKISSTKYLFPEIFFNIYLYEIIEVSTFYH